MADDNGINDISDFSKTEEMVEYLVERCMDEQPYTWVGPILLYVNNYRISDTSDDDMEDYESLMFSGTTLNQCMKPHIESIVNRARYRVKQGLGKRNQTIKITGTANSGTLYITRKIIEYLLSTEKKLIRRRTDNYNFRQIDEVLPLIKSMSCIRTEDGQQILKSSQLIKLYYEKGSIRGARVDSFLIEPTRVVNTSKNFEIFYQMMAGLSDDDLKELQLSRNTRYYILGHNYTKENEYYVAQFNNTMKAIKTIGFTEKRIKEFFQVLSLLIHMGNIKFIINTESCGVNLIDKESLHAVENVCRLMAVTKEKFVKKFSTLRIIRPEANQTYSGDLYHCWYQLFVMMTKIYETLFSWSVDQTNTFLISNERDCNVWLGIFTTSEFESIPRNNMEGLCLNYAAERIHLDFMEEYLEEGFKEYNSEKVFENPLPDSIENCRKRVKIIENSVLDAVNTTNIFIVLSCLELLRQRMIISNLNDSEEYLKVFDDTFVISHYVCPTRYPYLDVVVKNGGEFPSSLASGRSKNKLLCKLFKRIKLAINEDIFGRRSTTLLKLKNNLDKLTEEFAKSDVHYIQCINSNCDDSVEVHQEVRAQLEYSGIIDALPLARVPFCIKFTHDEYHDRYWFDNEFRAHIKVQLVREIFREHNFSESDCYVGFKTIFFSEECFFKLELYRKNYKNECAIRRMKSFSVQRKNRWLALTSNTARNNISKNKLNESSDLSGSDWENFFLNDYTATSPECNIDCMHYRNKGQPCQHCRV